MIHFLLLLQIVLSKMCTNGVVYTPCKAEIPKNVGEDTDFINPNHTSEMAVEGSRQSSRANAFNLPAELIEKTKGTRVDPIYIATNCATDPSLSEVHMSNF